MEWVMLIRVLLVALGCAIQRLKMDSDQVEKVEYQGKLPWKPRVRYNTSSFQRNSSFQDPHPQGFTTKCDHPLLLISPQLLTQNPVTGRSPRMDMKPPKPPSLAERVTKDMKLKVCRMATRSARCRSSQGSPVRRSRSSSRTCKETPPPSTDWEPDYLSGGGDPPCLSGDPK